MINILNKEVQEFIANNLEADVNELVLRHQEVGGVPIGLIADQIESRRRAKAKVPEWYRTPGIIFPSPLSMEQCSSEKTAEFKFLAFSGNNALDLTGGAGVDSYFLSKRFSKVDYVEIQNGLLETTKHNFKVLEVSNIACHNVPAEKFLVETNNSYDLIYIDPSRRAEGRKMVSLQDCEPNVLQIQDELLNRTDNAIIKTSPLLDIQKCLNDLNGVYKVIILAVKNEVKEVLYHLKTDNVGMEVEVIAVNITGNSGYDEFSFNFEQERRSQSVFADPDISDFLYEPNSSILKGGAFKFVAQKWSLGKLDISTHLYTSQEIIDDFQGRIFQVKKVFKSISTAKKELKGIRLNIISRNHPLNPENLKRKLHTLDGGDQYLIACQVRGSGKRLFLCNRLK